MNLIDTKKISIKTCVTALNTTSSVNKLDCATENSPRMGAHNGLFTQVFDELTIRGANKFHATIGGSNSKGAFSVIDVEPTEWIWGNSYFWSFDNKANKFYRDFKAAELFFHLEY